MKDYRKIIKCIIITTIIMLIFYLTGAISFENLSDPKNSDICWNIVTINSVFAGFMFTSLSMLISVITSETIKRLEKAYLMDEIYKNILCGIYCSLASIAFALITIFITPNMIEYTQMMNEGYLKQVGIIIEKHIIPFLMVYTMILSILCFLGSVLDVRFIIRNLRNKISKGNIPEESKSKILEKIK
ncbi:hypothetical protein QTL86_03575 [Cellulosilyticum sp. ST5]|uniref:hypothetical protein n=1 Tax=Cellulosilyticum sp. ST5 TaxID=3055805 RepID=UPI003977C818